MYDSSLESRVTRRLLSAHPETHRCKKFVPLAISISNEKKVIVQFKKPLEKARAETRVPRETRNRVQSRSTHSIALISKSATRDKHPQREIRAQKSLASTRRLRAGFSSAL